MILTTKDTIANVATIAGAGSALAGWDTVLTIILIVTGIVFNVVRIYEIKRNRKKRE
jgi:chromate transport protein ChrA